MPRSSFLKQTGLVFSQEMKQYLFSKKIIILFLLFAGILFLLTFVSIKFPQKMLQEVVKSGEFSEQEIQQIKQAFSTAERHPNPVVRHLLSTPLVNWLVFSFSLFVLPLIIFITGYNAISGEISQRNIQYYLIRIPRIVFFLGKVLAAICVIVCVLVASHSIVLFYSKWKLLPAEFDELVTNMLVFDGYLVIYSLCYIGFIFLMSSFFKRPPIALLMAFVIPIVAGFLHVFRLGFLLPSRYVRYFYLPDMTDIAKALSAYTLFALIFFSCSLIIFIKKDLQ